MTLIQGNIFEIISKGYKDAFDAKRAHIAPNIPDKKMNGSIKGVAQNSVSPNQVLLVLDATLLGAGSDGILLSNEAIYLKDSSSKPESIKYTEIEEVKYEKIVTNNKKGKEEVSENVLIIGAGQAIKVISSCVNCKDFAILINSLAASSHSSNSKKGALERKPLEDMPIDIRKAYVKVIINYFLSDDEKIDEMEYSQLYSLIGRLKFNAHERFELSDYHKNPEETQVLVNDLLEQVYDFVKQEIVYSLAKDLIFIHGRTKGTKYTASEFITTFAKDYNISDEQMIFLKKAIENDEKIYDDNVDDSGLEKGFRTIASSAAAVSVPLMAVYFSGSVIGLGATGITSGLAALGLGGVFGFSSMATGLGAILIIGLGAKMGIEHLTGQGEVDKRKRKEALLLEVKKQLQRSINMLIEDINFIVEKLSLAFEKSDELQYKLGHSETVVGQLVGRLSVLSASSQVLIKDRDAAELYAIRQGVPRQLDVPRLEALTNEPTTQELCTLVLDCYDKKEDIYSLKGNISLEKIKSLSTVLHGLGYFSVAGLAKKGINKLSGFLNR